MRRVYKYATGEPIPDGAVHVATVTQTSIFNEAYETQYEEIAPRFVGPITVHNPAQWVPCWLVWHYYEVEVDE